MRRDYKSFEPYSTIDKSKSRKKPKSKKRKPFHGPDHPDVKFAKKFYRKRGLSAGSDEEVGRDLDKIQEEGAKKRTKTVGSS